MDRHYIENGPIHSRQLFAILFCLLFIGVGNVWGTDVTINFGTTTEYWAAHTSDSYTDSDSRSWSRTYSAGNKSSGQAGYSQFGNKDNTCTSLILTATAGKAMTVTAFSVTMAGGSASTAGTIYLYKRTSGGTETQLATQSLSGNSDVTCSISSNATFTSTDILKVSYVGTAKSIQIKTLSYSYSTGGGSKYTVSFNTGTGNPSQDDIAEESAGGGITLPNVTPTCSGDGWALYGWATSACSSETSTAPTIVGKAGDTYYPTSATTLYAVYAKGEYTKITSTSDLNTTSKYFFASVYSTKNYVMTSSCSSNKLAAKQIDETSSGKYHAALINADWCYTLESSSSKWFIVDCNSSNSNHYLDTYYDAWYGHEKDSYDSYTFAYSSSSWTITNSYGSNKYFGYSSSDGAFKPFSSAQNLQIYKQTTTPSYYSTPTCCTPLGSINGSFFLTTLFLPLRLDKS